MILAVTKELASLAWHVIFPTNKNTLAKFHNLAALQLFQVLMCQIWVSALAFPQKTYWSTASAVSQAWLSVSHHAPAAAFEARQGTREELSSSVAYSRLPVHPILEMLSKSFFLQYPRLGGILGSVFLKATPEWKLNYSLEQIIFL